MHSVKFDVKSKDRIKGVGLNLQESSEGGVNEGRVKLQWCLMDLEDSGACWCRRVIVSGWK
jgi:hypothetical protein